MEQPTSKRLGRFSDCRDGSISTGPTAAREAGAAEVKPNGTFWNYRGESKPVRKIAVIEREMVKAIREANRARARETFLKSEYDGASQAAMKANNDLQDLKTELETAFWNRAMERAK
jgi:hypothetical protein